MKYLFPLAFMTVFFAANFAVAACDYQTIAKSSVGKGNLLKKDCQANQRELDIDAKFKEEKMPPTRIDFSERQGRFKDR